MVSHRRVAGSRYLTPPDSEQGILRSIALQSLPSQIQDKIRGIALHDALVVGHAICFSRRGDRREWRTPNFNVGVLSVNHQFRDHGIKFLYGANIFSAAHPCDLFYPNDFYNPRGPKPLPKKATRYIRHLVLVKSGTWEQLCNETCQTIFTPIYKMIDHNPPFLKLKSLTIGCSVSRSMHLNSCDLQTYMDAVGEENNNIQDITSKKNIILRVVAALCLLAVEREIPWRYLILLQDREGIGTLEKSNKEMSQVSSTVTSCFSVCLTREDHNIAQESGSVLDLNHIRLEALPTEREEAQHFRDKYLAFCSKMAEQLSRWCEGICLSPLPNPTRNVIEISNRDESKVQG